MRVLYITSEVYPFCKTGGLADVCSAASPQPCRNSHRLRLLVPGYKQAIEQAPICGTCSGSATLGCGEVRLLGNHLPHC